MVSGICSNLWIGNFVGGKLVMVEFVVFKNICGVFFYYIHIYIYIFFFIFYLISKYISMD